MIEAEERRRLMERLGRPVGSPLGAVLKCAAGLLLLVIIAAGPWVLLTSGGTTAATEAQSAPNPGAAMAASRRVLDEKRGVHESARHGGRSQAGNASRTWLAVE